MATLYLLLVFVFSFSFPAHANYSLLKSHDNFLLLDDQDQLLLSITRIGFKPGWKWLRGQSLDDKSTEKNYHYYLDDGAIKWQLEIAITDERILELNNTFEIIKDTELLYAGIALKAEAGLAGGEATFEDDYEHLFTSPYPLNREQLFDIERISFQDKSEENQVRVKFSQPTNIHNHTNSRFQLIEGKLKAGERYTQKITIKTQSPIEFFSSPDQLPNGTNHSDWYAFQPKHKYKKSVLSMRDWLSPVQEPLSTNKSNTSQKIWGTNINYTRNAPSKRDAKTRANFFAHYGINSIRMHKLTNDGWEGLGNGKNAGEYDIKKLRLMDYFTKQLKEKGISYGFSPIWDLKIYPKDKEKLLAYDEIVAANPKKPVTTGLVWFADDVQALHIKALTNLLNYKNTYTGLPYSQDNNLAYIEIQNEESALFYTFIKAFKKMPTYHKLLAEKFSDWLKEKYKTHNGLVQHWGTAAINTFSREGGLADEHLDKRNITPVINPWYFDNQGSGGHRAKRLQDTAEFVYELQNNYYRKAIAAIRETGYKGPIVNSNWQAGAKGTHFLNLLSDAQADIIDRHNYQGGPQGHPQHLIKTGMGLNNKTMLDDPGSGLLSIGMQQIKDYPFMVSEWLALPPSEWAAADTVLTAAYGFGLQGWDMSYHFASDMIGFSKQFHHRFDAMHPAGVGLFPVLSRMTLRGDFKEAEPIAIRRLNKTQALTNQYDFENSLVQHGDLKSFTGTPHHNALAVGKVLIEFTEGNGKSSIGDWKKYQSKKGNETHTTSSTGELTWIQQNNKKDKKGYALLNSNGTQGLVGFTRNRQYDFNDLSITPESPYSVILTTAKSPDKQLHNDDEAIIIAMARVHNTGMNLTENLIANLGTAPLILEPVKATINFKRQKGIVDVLNHDGAPTGTQYFFTDGQFILDTGKDKTPYFRVRFQ